MSNSWPTKVGTSASNPNVETLDWKTCTEEDQLDKIIRKKLENLYDEAQSILVYKGFDEEIALKGLLKRGYCVGKGGCLSNIVENSLEFLTGKDVESEQDRPQPFQRLELLVEFNLHFMLYILQKYRLDLDRISIRQCILMTHLNLNRAIMMNIKDTPFVITEMPLNLDYEDGDNGEKDGFLALEIRELFNNLDIFDDSVSDDMKDAMIDGLQKPIDDLKLQLEERIRWASKKVVEARTGQPLTMRRLREKFERFHCYTECMLAKRESELFSVNIELANAEETIKRLEMVKEGIKSEIWASKQKEELKEKFELEKKRISKLEQQLAETLAALIAAKVKLEEVMEAKKVAIAQVYQVCQLALDRWKGKVVTLRIPTIARSSVLVVAKKNIILGHKARLMELVSNSMTKVRY